MTYVPRLTMVPATKEGRNILRQISDKTGKQMSRILEELAKAELKRIYLEEEE